MFQTFTYVQKHFINFGSFKLKNESEKKLQKIKSFNANKQYVE